MKSGITKQLIPDKVLCYVLVIFWLVVSNFHCAMLPELEQYRTDKITRGPDFSPYLGLKKRIAVLDFENSSGFGGDKLGSAIADMLISQLVRSGRFNVIERSRIDQILREQAWGQSGAISEDTAPKVGQLLGVECLILGRIIEAGQETGDRKIEDKKDEWKFRLRTTIALARISYKMINTTTGEIISADNISEKEIKPGFGLETKDFDFKNMFDFDQTLIGVAFRKAIVRVAQDIVTHVDQIEWIGKIVQARADTVVYFTPGKGAGVQLDHLFEVYERVDAQNVDDMLGEQPLSINQPKARIKVTGFIGDRVARAKVMQGSGISRGDIVKFVGTFAKNHLE